MLQRIGHAENQKSQKQRFAPNLYERKGYYTYRDPRTRKEYGLGRNKAYAINEAINANQLLINKEDTKPLTERIEGHGSVSFHEFLDRYETILHSRGLREKTLKDYKSKLSAIRKGTIDAPIENITTKNIADFIRTYISDNKISMAKKIRITLKDMFDKAISSRIIVNNPVLPTKTPKVKIQRSRLSLSDFNTILNLINNNYQWLIFAMKIALVTGQRVSDIAKIKWDDIYDDKLWVIQQKTGVKIAIPLKIEIIGIKLSTILKINKNNSECIISDSGKRVSVEKISKTFAKFRDKTNLTWEGDQPSFHEIRSLSARFTQKN